MYKYNSIFFILIICFSYCFATEINRSIPLIDENLKGISTNRLFEIGAFYDDSNFAYIEEVEKKQNIFLSKFQKLNGKSDLQGKWTLRNLDNSIVSEKWSFYTGDSFIIEEYNSLAEYHYKSNVSFIYTNGSEFYFFPSVNSLILKKIVINENKLYLYILENNEWIMDPIHEEGKYFYIKE